MQNLAHILTGILREAWTACAGMLAVVLVLIMLAQMLRAASGTFAGANGMLWRAVSTLACLLLIGLFAFTGIPMLTQAAAAAIPASISEGPIQEIGNLAAGLLSALGALRMLRAVFGAVPEMLAGASGSLAEVFTETAETLLGMLAAGLVIPIATAFFTG